MRIFYCRVGWMKKYKGHVDNDRPVNGGKYNETHIGHEVYNFFPHNGAYYGFVQSGNIGIEKLGATKKDTEIDDVLVVWVSTKPSGGQYIVGWYKNATVYRVLQKAPDSVMAERDLKDYYDYNIFSKDATLLNENERKKTVKGMGHYNTWYGEAECDADVLKYIDAFENKQLAEITEIEKGLEQLEGIEKETVIKGRVNQNKFRDGLLKRYKHCCLCQVNDPHFLRASHIKPWSESAGTEKLDIDNGLLLCPNHDLLFDTGYISFNDDGSILISDQIADINRMMLNINPGMKIEVTEGNIEYIRDHRENKYKA